MLFDKPCIGMSFNSTGEYLATVHQVRAHEHLTLSYQPFVFSWNWITWEEWVLCHSFALLVGWESHIRLGEQEDVCIAREHPSVAVRLRTEMEFWCTRDRSESNCHWWRQWQWMWKPRTGEFRTRFPTSVPLSTDVVNLHRLIHRSLLTPAWLRLVGRIFLISHSSRIEINPISQWESRSRYAVCCGYMARWSKGLL